MPSPIAALLADAARRASGYLDGLDGRPVAASPDAVAALGALDQPFPEGPTDPAAVLEELDRRVSPATMAMAGPRFFGFVIGGALPATVAANVLATAWDQNSARWAVTPGTAAVERVALRWTLEALGLPPEADGGFVTGATVANFTALAAARHAVLARAGWDVEGRGLFGAPPITVVVGAEALIRWQDQERGLVMHLASNKLFPPAGAELTAPAKHKLADTADAIARYAIVVYPPGRVYNYANLDYGIVEQITPDLLPRVRHLTFEVHDLGGNRNVRVLMEKLQQRGFSLRYKKELYGRFGLHHLLASRGAS